MSHHNLKVLFKVNELFVSFQGEGPNTGQDAVFIRLSGCNLSCSFCDTKHDDGEQMSLEELLSEVRKVGGKCRFVVLTGGEPFLQPIELLCEELVRCGCRVQIETNGTVFREIESSVQVVCSPKRINGGFRVDEKMLARVDHLKFVVSKTCSGYCGVPEIGQSQYNIPIYVQPMDECCERKNKNNLLHAIDLCSKHGYKLSLQMHKLVGAR